jgi:hypothetical protein
MTDSAPSVSTPAATTPAANNQTTVTSPNASKPTLGKASKPSKYDYIPKESSTTTNTTTTQQATQAVQQADTKVNQAVTDVKKADAKVQQAEQKYKVTVNGQEKEVALQELQQAYSLAEGSRQKLQDAAAYRKQAEDFIGMLRKDPRSILMNPKLGIDFDSLAREHMIQRSKEAVMTPEQKAAWQAQEELKVYKQKEQEQKAAIQHQEIAKLTEDWTNHYKQTIPAALKTAGVPQNDRSVARIAYYIAQGKERGQNLSPEQVAPLVKQDFMDDIQALFGASDGDTLLSLLGEDTAKKLRQSDVKRLKSAGKTPDEPIVSKGRQAEPKKKIGLKQWRKTMDDKQF